LGRSFIKSRNHRNSQRRDETNFEQYASAVFHGISFSNDFQDRIDFDRPIRFNPEITLLEGNTRALINFNGCRDELENEYIDKVINGISLGDGFTLSDGQHIDSTSGEISNLSGGFTCGATFSKIIFAHVYTIDSAQNYNKKYRGDGFVGDVVTDFSALSSLNTNESNAITNLFGRNVSPSFETIGVRVRDLVRVETGSNTGKSFQVSGIKINSEDIETLFFGISADLAEESRLNQSTRMSFFRLDSVDTTRGEDLTISGTTVVLEPKASVSNTFKIAGVQQPTLRVQVGNTYIFNLNSNELFDNDLIFRISTTEDGKWNGGTLHPDIKLCGDALVFYPEHKGTYYYYSETKPNSGGIIIVSDAAPELQDTPAFTLNPSSSSYSIQDLTSTVFY